MYTEAARSIKNLEYVTNTVRCLQGSPWEVRRSSGLAAPVGRAHPAPTAFPGAGRTQTQPGGLLCSLEASNTKHGCNHQPTTSQRTRPQMPHRSRRCCAVPRGSPPIHAPQLPRRAQHFLLLGHFHQWNSGTQS